MFSGTLFSKNMWKQVKPTVLIYDAKCSLCCGCMNWIKQHAMDTDTFKFIACQSEERKNRFPDIGEEACLEALHLVTPEGRVLAGDKSLTEILGNLRYFRWLVIFFKMPVISLLSYYVYRRIANNRYIISQTILPLTQRKVWEDLPSFLRSLRLRRMLFWLLQFYNFWIWPLVISFYWYWILKSVGFYQIRYISIQGDNNRGIW